MKYSYIFDKNIFGTKASDLSIQDNQFYFGSNQNILNEAKYIDIEHLKLLSKLFGIQGITFPREKWVRIYKTLSNEKIDIETVPWKQIIPNEEFILNAKNYVSNIVQQLDSLDLSYLEMFEQYQGLFKKLKPAKISVQKCFKYMEVASSGQKELLKSFLPNEGFTSISKYSMTDTVTGRLSINSGPNILLLKKEFRDIIESRFGSQGKIIYLDFSSLEPRVLMTINNKQRAKSLPQDIYDHFRQENKLNNIERNIIKVAVISQLYGANEETLYKQLQAKISNPEEFVHSIKDYFGIEELKLRLKEQFVRSGNRYIQNHYGRYIFCGDAKPYVLLNYFIQSTAVDVALQGFTKIVKKIYAAQLQDLIVPLFVLHDALILDVHEDAYDAIPKLCKLGSNKIKNFEDINFYLKEEKIK